jgi:hypothetical protein
MASDLELVHLAFNRVKELSLRYDGSIPHLISSLQRTWPRRFRIAALESVSLQRVASLVD